MSAWRKCKPSTPNSTMTMQPQPPTLPLPTSLYAAPSIPSLVALLVEDPLLLLEKDTSAISNPSTISPILTTGTACLLSSSPMTTFMASTINKMTPWLSLLKSRTTLLRKSSWIRAAPLISSTGPPTKNFNFRTPPWSHMTSQSMASLVNKYPPVATSTSTPSFGREPKPKPSQSASLSSTRQQYPPGLSFPQYPWRRRLHPSLGHEVPFPFRRHPYHPLWQALVTRMLHGQPATTTLNPTNQPHWATPWLQHRPVRRRSRPQSKLGCSSRTSWGDLPSRASQ